jgi:hypothetical protein
LAGLADEEGFLHATVYEYPKPEPQTNQHTMDYSLLYGVALLEYLKETGDRATAEELGPVVKYQIEFARTYLKDFIYDVDKQPSWWLVFDWKDDLNRAAPIQGLMTFAIDKSYELACLLGGGDHTVKRLERQRNGLLANHVLARKERTHHDILVHVVGGSAYDNVKRRIGKHRLKGGINVDALRAGNLLTLRVDIINAGKLHDIALQRVITVPAALSAVTDDSNSFFHTCLPFRAEAEENFFVF